MSKFALFYCAKLHIILGNDIHVGVNADSSKNVLTFVKINNKNLLNTSMKTYNQNKALYESIMNDVAKIVKKRLNT